MSFIFNKKLLITCCAGFIGSAVIRYMYLLTPKEIEPKAKLTTSFLKTKMKEFEILKDEICQLKLDEEEMLTKQAIRVLIGS
jgi:dTDP-D-glucose 4,6-dehydratase